MPSRRPSLAMRRSLTDSGSTRAGPNCRRQVRSRRIVTRI